MFKLSMQQICDLLDLQVDNYEDEDRQILIDACNLIYDYMQEKKKNAKKKTKKKQSNIALSQEFTVSSEDCEVPQSLYTQDQAQG